MTFLNKKQQVFDFQLTPYGKRELSKGTFSPEYYAFFDDNVIYDKSYVSGSSVEKQNQIHNRIKRETQYIKSQTRFSQAMSGALVTGGRIDSIFPQDENLFTSQGFIGDAMVLADQPNYASAWKAVSLANHISSSSTEDTLNSLKIPQINLTASYNLKIFDPTQQSQADLASWQDYLEIGALSVTPRFSDGNAIRLEMNNPLFFIEELNTEFLTKNFDIEIFEVTDDGGENEFRRLYFQKPTTVIKDGILIEAQSFDYTETTSSVGYYFDLLKDSEINTTIACKYIQQFNLESLLIDLDFDCSEADSEFEFFDIYGDQVGDPEVC